MSSRAHVVGASATVAGGASHRCNSSTGPCGRRFAAVVTGLRGAPRRRPRPRFGSRSCRVSESFTHLHLHTEFSMLDGAARIDDVVAAAAADGQPAIGITDHGNMYGVLDFYQACQGPGRQADHRHRALPGPRAPHRAAGRRGRMDDTGGDTDGGRKAYYHLTALAENDAGYKNLIQLRQPGLPRGLLQQAPGRLGAARGPQRGGHRHHGLPRVATCCSRCMQGDYDEARSRRRPGSRTSSGATTSSSSSRTTASPSSAAPTRSCSRSPAASARPSLATNDSHYTHQERPRRPRRPAVRADRVAR